MTDKSFIRPIDLQIFAQKRFKEYYQKEVIIGKTSEFKIGRDTYSPEPDIAVGPFSTGQENLTDTYDDMANDSRIFINKCLKAHQDNLRTYKSEFLESPSFSYFYSNMAVNQNARCFIAVEIENKPPSLKHILGSTINALALGRVALLVGFSDVTVLKFMRCLKYLNFLKSVKKTNLRYNHAMVLSKKQFIEILIGIK